MERCPVCNARWNGKRICHRCKSEVGKLADIETASDDLYRQAVAACRATDYTAMMDCALRACSLRSTPENIQMAACAAVMSRRFYMALGFYKKLACSEQDNSG